jgi:hypothetical protein
VAARLGDHIHLVAGRSPEGGLNGAWRDHGDVPTHRRLDPAADRWDTASPAPHAVGSAAGAVVDGRLYVVGGRLTSGEEKAWLMRYDPVADRWDNMAPMPLASGGLAAAAAGGKLYAFGGEWFEAGKAGVFPYVFEYDLARNRWREVARMITARHGLGAATVGGRIYAVAGAAGPNNYGPTGFVEVFEPA